MDKKKINLNLIKKLDNKEIKINQYPMLLTRFGLQVLKNSEYIKNMSKISSKIQDINNTSFISFRYPYLFSTQTIVKEHELTTFLKSSTTIQKLKLKQITSFFPIQAKTYNQIYAGKDVIAADKTGSGKTLAFALPVIEKLRDQKQLAKNGIKFVVLGPTRELASQIGNEILELKHNEKDFNVLTVYGGINVYNNLKELGKKIDVLVGTPGRVKDLIERGALNFQHVKVVCIDEADYMFDIGFQQTRNYILKAILKDCKNFQMLCFTATPNNGVVQTVKQYMKKDVLLITTKKQTAAPKSIKHYLIKTPYYSKLAITQHIIKNKSNDGKVIIFTNTKVQSDMISQSLKIPNVLLHGNIDQSHRLHRLKLFKQGKIKVLIATDVAARGLDIANVQAIINYQLPAHYQGYIHRSGRTGRAGKNGVCFSLYNQNSVQNEILTKIQQLTSIHFQQMEISKEELAETNKINKDDNSQQMQQKNNNQGLSSQRRNNYQKSQDRQKRLNKSQDKIQSYFKKQENHSSIKRFDKQPSFKKQENRQSFKRSDNRAFGKKSDNVYEQNKLVLFDTKSKLNKWNVQQFLKQNGKKFQLVQQIISAKTGHKFYIISFNQQNVAQQTLLLTIKLDKNEELKFFKKRAK